MAAPNREKEAQRSLRRVKEAARRRKDRRVEALALEFILLVLQRISRSLPSASFKTDPG